MPLVPLSGANKHIFAFVDEEDLVYVHLHKWYLNRGGYAWSSVWNPITRKNEAFRMHRMILEARLGRRLDKSDIVDHINKNKLDNRSDNLRVTDKQVNAINSNLRKDNKYGYKGVTYSWCYKNGQRYIRKKPWITQLKSKQFGKYTAYHKTKLEAAIDYDIQARKWFGKDAVLNFP